MLAEFLLSLEYAGYNYYSLEVELMRGFALTIDMALAATGVVLLFFILLQSVNPPLESRALGPLLAQDAAVEWVYTGNQSLAPVGSLEYYCSTGIRPAVSDEILDPANSSSWESVINCVEAP